MHSGSLPCGRRARCATLFALILPLARDASAQAAPVALRPVADSFPYEFTRIRSVRELSDGRLLVSDAFGLYVTDWRRDSTRVLGRQGEGPNEYRTPLDLWAFRGDSTLFTDDGTYRTFLLVGDRFVDTHTAQEPLNRHLGVAFAGMDHAGRRLSLTDVNAARVRQMRRDRRREPAVPESAFVLLGHFPSNRIDSVAKVAVHTHVRRERAPRTDPAGVPHRLPNPLAVDEQAVLFPDGWIAIARLDPYRVDWIAPRGSVVRGAPIDTEPQRADERERLAAIDRMYPRDDGPRPFLPEDFPPWPEFVPAFTAVHALMAAPNGHLLVHRMPTARGADNRYDLIDRTGRRTRQLVIPDNARLMGFGAGVVYVVTKDANDLERLWKHPWP